MSIQLKTINKQVVNAIPLKKDGRKPKGFDICGDDLYLNIALIASTNSGKSTALMHLIKQCADKNTKIVAFVSTFYNDPIWKEFRKWCDSKNIEFEGYTDIFEDGENLLVSKIKDMEEEALQREEDEDKVKEEPVETLESILKQVNGIQTYIEAPEKEKKPRKSKFATPEQIFIFDDMGHLVKDKYFVTLLRKARHYHITTITSIQSLKQCGPQTLEQMRMYLIFGGQSKMNIEHIWQLLNMKVRFEVFYMLYKRAVEPTKKTPKPFFLFKPRCDFYGRY
jgi:hypothetical protein